MSLTTKHQSKVWQQRLEQRLRKAMAEGRLIEHNSLVNPRDVGWIHIPNYVNDCGFSHDIFRYRIMSKSKELKLRALGTEPAIK